MTQLASTQLTFKKAWSFPVPVEKRITTFVKNVGGNWLHAPVGISQLGKGIFESDLKVLTLDKNPDVKPDIVCDIFKMTDNKEIKKIMKECGGFDGVISDPIWYTKEKQKTIGLAYPDRRYLSYQVRDVLKPGGWWVFNGLWNPIVKGLSIRDIEIPMQAFSSFRNLSLIVYLKKVNEVFT
jgi:hypothetical protein